MNKKSSPIEITPDNTSGISSVPKSYKTRLSDVENLTKAILAVALISLVSIVVAVCALVLDQMHFNNQTYRDQSDKTNAEIRQLNAQIEVLKSQLQPQQPPTVGQN